MRGELGRPGEGGEGEQGGDRPKRREDDGELGPKPAATKEGGGTGEQGPAGEEGFGRDHAEVEGGCSGGGEGCGSWRMKATGKDAGRGERKRRKGIERRKKSRGPKKIEKRVF